MIRFAVVVCVSVASVVALAKLDDALGVLDARADANAALTYSERTYPSQSWVAGDPTVLEDARRRIPPDATYRVVVGGDSSELSDFAHYFPLGLLLPRRQTASGDAEWLLCYACDESAFPEYDVLSAGDELWLGRRAG